jgi:uncharacterized membrane protein
MHSWTEIADPASRAAIADYFRRVDRMLAPLSSAEAADIRRELETHVLDAIKEGGTAVDALGALGDPDDFLPSLVADRLRARAARTFNPSDVAAALARSARDGVAGLALSIVVGAVYTVATLSIFLGVLKIFAPAGTGVFRLESGRIFIGSDGAVRGVDLLGFWFVPIAVGTGLALYFAMTWMFGRARLRRRRPGTDSIAGN